MNTLAALASMRYPKEPGNLNGSTWENARTARTHCLPSSPTAVIQHEPCANLTREKERIQHKKNAMQISTEQRRRQVVSKKAKRQKKNTPKRTPSSGNPGQNKKSIIMPCPCPCPSFVPKYSSLASGSWAPYLFLFLFPRLSTHWDRRVVRTSSCPFLSPAS